MNTKSYLSFLKKCRLLQIEGDALRTKSSQAEGSRVGNLINRAVALKSKSYDGLSGSVYITYYEG